MILRTQQNADEFLKGTWLRPRKRNFQELRANTGRTETVLTNKTID